MCHSVLASDVHGLQKRERESVLHIKKSTSAMAQGAERTHSKMGGHVEDGEPRLSLRCGCSLDTLRSAC